MKKEISSISLYTFLVLFTTINALGFHGFHYKGLEEPRSFSLRKSNERWIEQPLDHFNHRDNRTWQMRYFEEDKYFNNSGPIFIILGGEWTISDYYMKHGLMHDIAKEHGGLMFSTEHRYYGSSRPTEDMSTENLQYLSSDQALADVAYFINKQKLDWNITDSKVIVFGGSYAGNLAAWLRLKYPHLVQGAIASSGPVFAKADFFEYYEVVTASLNRHDPQCVKDVEEAIDEVESLLLCDEGPEKIGKIFNLCEGPNVKSKKDVSYFMGTLTELFAHVVQYNAITPDGKSNISRICDTLTNATIGKPIERLAKLLIDEDECSNDTYTEYLKKYRNATWGVDPMRQWQFQTCTEFGYFQTTNSTKSVFGTLFNLDFFVDLCTDLFGEYYEKNLLDSSIERTNIMYGGRLPDVSNVIFVNGDVDPWHALSVLEDLNESSPAILIKGSSHCQDLKHDVEGDVVGLRKARKTIKTIVDKWLKQ